MVGGGGRPSGRALDQPLPQHQPEVHTSAAVSPRASLGCSASLRESAWESERPRDMLA